MRRPGATPRAEGPGAHDDRPAGSRRTWWLALLAGVLVGFVTSAFAPALAITIPFALAAAWAYVVVARHRIPVLWPLTLGFFVGVVVTILLGVLATATGLLDPVGPVRG